MAQYVHLNRLFFEWMYECFVKLAFWTNARGHDKHLYGLSPLCILMWSKKLCHLRCTFPQFLWQHTSNRIILLAYGTWYSKIANSWVVGACILTFAFARSNYFPEYTIKSDFSVNYSNSKASIWSWIGNFSWWLIWSVLSIKHYFWIGELLSWY